MNMKIITTLIAAAFAVTSFQARAEVNEVKLARQFGLHYLPLVLMEKHNLIEKAAAAAHVDLKASWLQISASGINESLLSGAIDVSATGTGPLVLMWDRTHGNLGVKGIAAISEVPMILTSRNPSFKSLKDMSSKDRIAMPAVGLGSMQAVTLKAAAVDLFGKGAVNKFDANVVAMTHPDAAAALLSGKSEVNAHFTAAPYSYMELQDPKIHRVLSSYDVWGGQSTLITINATTAIKLGLATPRLGVVYGRGIATYMNDGGMDLAPAVSTIFQPPSVILVPRSEAVKLLGVSAYVDFQWAKAWSSAIGYSFTKVENTNFAVGGAAAAICAAAMTYGSSQQWTRSHRCFISGASRP